MKIEYQKIDNKYIITCMSSDNILSFIDKKLISDLKIDKNSITFLSNENLTNLLSDISEIFKSEDILINFLFYIKIFDKQSYFILPNDKIVNLYLNRKIIYVIYYDHRNNYKIYIGKTNNIKQRLEDHKTNKKILFVELFFEELDTDEDTFTVKYAQKHGVNKVMGGRYAALPTMSNTVRDLQLTIWHMENKCIKCGNSNHFAKNCDITNICNFNTTHKSIYFCENRVRLHSKYQEKDTIKLLGAKWDVNLKFWHCCECQKNTFMKWINENNNLNNLSYNDSSSYDNDYVYVPLDTKKEESYCVVM
jgi:hypothetical protein